MYNIEFLTCCVRITHRTVCQCVVVSVVVNRVATYRELDNDLLQHAQFLSLDNEVDLKLLAKSLSAEADVQEVGLCFIAKT